MRGDVAPVLHVYEVVSLTLEAMPSVLPEQREVSETECIPSLRNDVEIG